MSKFLNINKIEQYCTIEGDDSLKYKACDIYVSLQDVKARYFELYGEVFE